MQQHPVAAGRKDFSEIWCGSVQAIGHVLLGYLLCKSEGTMCTFLTAGRYCTSWLQGEAVSNVYTAL